MFDFLKKIFGSKPDRKAKALKRRAPAEDGPRHMQIADASARKKLAMSAGTSLADAAAMADDPDVDVRLALAARLVNLLPDLSPERHAELYAYAVQALTALAQDEVLLVRRALSTALKDYAKAPPSVVGRLARDVEREVAEPILRFCVALDDAELIDILSGHPQSWVVAAIAGRPVVSEEVSDAVVGTNDAPGTEVLISNSGARFLPATLEGIVERAREYPSWHKSLALRPEITLDIARQLAGFVSGAVLDVLKERSDFDAPTRRGIAALVERRVSYMAGAGTSATPQQKLLKYVAEGKLTPDVIQDALAWQEKEFIILALSYLAKAGPEVVKRILGSGSAKAIVALCWKAQLPPRLSLDIQRFAGNLQPRDLLYPKGGTDYPMEPAELARQLEFFGIRP